MSRLSDLLLQVETHDRQLAADLKREMEALSARRAFGLNFERHIPEVVQLPNRPVRRGDKVRFLPERSEKPSNVDRRLWRVGRIRQTDEGRVADLVSTQTPEAEQHSASRAVEDLVVVAEFRDPIYPGLLSTGKVERSGDRPFHTVINAENFFALQTLLYTHEGKVDAIYIDPPYNTGARDWKYNNDYVDKDDAYRHSKWLAMMERRLKLARRLLNPAGSVLIVTIDEKEYLRLGLLLEQLFPTARIQMVSTNVNPAAASRAGAFGRSDEYIFFVMLGVAPERLMLDRNWVSTKGRTHTGEPRWDLLRRSGSGAARRDAPGCYYPIYVDVQKPSIICVGEPLPQGTSVAPMVPGATAILPIRKDGSEGRWMMTPNELRSRIPQGRVRINVSKKGQNVVIYYLADGEFAKIMAGEFLIDGYAADGSMMFPARNAQEATYVLAVPGTQWRIPSHDSTQYGTRLLADFLPGRKFPFPKSLYAVEDALRFFVKEKRNAVVLDFFAGSGTTTHAVCRLNRQDGGQRQSISITNNEVSPKEANDLRQNGLRPGDPGWEAVGVFEHIARPRIEAAITGITYDGSPVSGGYKFTDGFPMAEGFEENVEFFRMSYEQPRAVAHNRAFEAIAPLLWLRAGSQGRRIEKAQPDFELADAYAVLFDLDALQDFLTAVGKAQSVRIAFIVTDDERAFQMVCSELPARVEAVRLYESYLTNFTINSERE